MTINTLIDQVKKVIAPTVMVERFFDTAVSAVGSKQAATQLERIFQLQLLEKNGDFYRFRFPGSAIVSCAQVKVIWGGMPEAAAYQQLQSYVELEHSDDRRLCLRAYERLIGTPAEQHVYRQVLEARLEAMINCISELV